MPLKKLLLVILAIAIAAAVISCGAKDETGDDVDYSWWGSYINEQENKTISISNYTGTTLLFTITTMAGESIDGAAPVSGDHKTAEYMDLIFSISEDSDTITVSIPERRSDSASRDIFKDVYSRTEN